jgi:hypothetical protein
MNWIFEAYSNVYNTAMMQDRVLPVNAAPAKDIGRAARLMAILTTRG